MTSPSPSAVAHEHTLRLRLPQQEGLCLRFPGVVRNEQRALEMLGGEDGISHALQQDKQLQCHLRPGDPYAHPVFSTEEATYKFLLRVKRTATGPNAAVLEAEVVARLPTSHEFNSPADFQVVSSAVPRVDRSGPTVLPCNRAEVAEPLRGEEPLLLLPPIFVKGDTQFNYGFQGVTRKEPAASLPVAPSTKANQISMTEPAPDYVDEVALAAVRATNAALVDALLLKFQQRPVWLYPALRHDLQELGPASELDTALQLTTYRFTSGPWKHALVRRGYDPRSEPAAHAYQLLTYHLPASWCGSVLHQELDSIAASDAPLWSSSMMLTDRPDAAIARTYPELLTLKRIPSARVSFFQVCDLQEPSVSAALSSEGRLTACSERSGWYGPGAWLQAQQALATKLDALIPDMIGLADGDHAREELDAPAMPAPLPAAGTGQSVGDENDWRSAMQRISFQAGLRRLGVTQRAPEVVANAAAPLQSVDGAQGGGPGDNAGIAPKGKADDAPVGPTPEAAGSTPVDTDMAHSD